MTRALLDRVREGSLSSLKIKYLSLDLNDRKDPTV